MTLDEYQEKALSTMTESSKRIDYLALGLAGEAGETADKIKKIIRDKGATLNTDCNIKCYLRPEEIQLIAKEIGDVLWYVASLSHMFGFTLDGIARMNINKLAKRKAEGKIKGSGDER